MKKQIILAGLAVFALASCTSNESVLESVNQKISFNVKNYSLQTKANQNYDTLYQDIPFGTYAWFYEDDLAYPADSALSQKFMIDETVSHSSSEDLWEPSKTYYWPKSGSIDFVSYSPKNMTNYFTISQDSIAIKDYTVTTSKTEKSTVDLMYADKAIGQTANSDIYYHVGVPTLFHHALAKLNFNMAVTKTDDGNDPATEWTVIVKKVELVDITNNGSVKLVENGSSWNKPTNEVWSPATTPSKLSPVFYEDEEGDTLTTTATDFEVVKDYIVIPQTLLQSDSKTGVNGQQLKITYDVVTVTSAGTTIKEEGVSTSIDLYTSSKPSWKMNENITYTVMINPSDMDPILFDPAVADWDDVSATANVNL